MFEKAVEKYPPSLKYLSDHFKMQEMCDEAVDIEPRSLEFVPDRFKLKRCVKKQLRSTHRA